MDEEVLPAHRSVKSIYNITRERSWRPLWEKELGNIKHEYLGGKLEAGFREGVYVHQCVCCVSKFVWIYVLTPNIECRVISTWLWGAIVQYTLDKYRRGNEVHRVRFQEKSLLPTNGRRIDFYNYPEDFGGEDCLIKVPKNQVCALLEKYDNPRLLKFGNNEEVTLCEGLYNAIGAPKLEHHNGWKIFKQMIAEYVRLVEGNSETE